MTSTSLYGGLPVLLNFKATGRPNDLQLDRNSRLYGGPNESLSRRISPYLPLQAIETRLYRLVVLVCLVARPPRKELLGRFFDGTDDDASRSPHQTES